jgi:polar amino acid transport system substrate-binding protein
VYDFSTPYFNSDIGVLAKADATFDEKSIKTAKVGIQQATTGAAFMTDKVGISSPQVFPDAGSMFAALTAGQIDVAVTDTSIVLAQEVQGGGKTKVIGQYQTGETYGAIYPKGNANNAIIDKIIASMIADGTIAKLSGKYLAAAWGKDPASIAYFKP